MITQNKIQNIAETIANTIKPDKIILYGSYAWGKPDEQSDVDLFIIQKSNLTRIDRARNARKAIWGMGVPVDISVYTPNEVERRLNIGDFFIKDIINKGKILYG